MRFSAKSLPTMALCVMLGVGLAGGAFFVYRKLKPQYRTTYSLADDILVHGNTSLKEIALTFDDGPRPETARPILDALAKQGVRATFFVVGSQIEKHPSLVRRMIQDGHEVGNHSFSHQRLDTINLGEVRKELADTNRAFLAATGTHLHLFRPPGMRYTEDVLKLAQDMGYVTIHWNVAAQDYQRQPAKEIVRKVLNNTEQGSVILLHLQPDTAEALPEIVTSLKAQGYRFVTVSQMLGRLPRPVFAKSNAYALDPKLAALDKPKPAEPAKRTRPSKLARNANEGKSQTSVRDDSYRAPHGIDAPAGG